MVRALRVLVLFLLTFSAFSFAQESLRVVINEFGQGKGGFGEWVELLVVGADPCSTVDLRNWVLRDFQGDAIGGVWVKFANLDVWKAVPAGTIILIYNAGDTANLPDHFPSYPDEDFSDFLVVLPHTHAYFASPQRWEGLANGGDWVVLQDATGSTVDGISYGDRPGQTPHLSAVGARRAAAYTRAGTDGINDAANWVVGYERATDGSPLSTPGRGNTEENAAWIASLRPRPAISVSPLSWDFGAVNVGTESLPLVVTVANTGCANLSVGTLYLSGSDVDPFRIQNDDCSEQAISPGGSRTVEVVFRPTSVGTKSATLVIPSNDPDRPEVHVSLTGTGTVTALSVDAGGPYTGRVGVPITLRASASGGLSPYTFAWDLDADGEFDDAEGAEITYTWYAPGFYTVQVRVRDSLGNAATDTAEVRVLPARGDVNGDGAIDLVDLRLAYQAALGLISLAPEQTERADLDDDGDVDMVDVELLCRLILGGCG
jgi:hypothetical protein